MAYLACADEARSQRAGHYPRPTVLDPVSHRPSGRVLRVPSPTDLTDGSVSAERPVIRS
jgi:hypothetical protein